MNKFIYPILIFVFAVFSFVTVSFAQQNAEPTLYNANLDNSMCCDDYDRFVSEDKVSVTKDTKFNVFAIGDKVKQLGNIGGSGYIAGDKVIVEGDTKGSLFLMGDTIFINGDVEGSVFVFASKVVLNGNVSGNAYIAGSEVYINSPKIGGELNVKSSQVYISENTVVTKNKNILLQRY